MPRYSGEGGARRKARPLPRLQFNGPDPAGPDPAGPDPAGPDPAGLGPGRGGP